MNNLLKNSLKIAYETSDVSLDELMHSYGIDNPEDQEELLNESLSWTKASDESEDSQLVEVSPKDIIDNDIASVPNPTLPITIDTPAESQETDEIKKKIDTATEKILDQCIEQLTDSYDLETKELKDIASTVQLVENMRYPKNQPQKGLEIDMSKGIVRFFEGVIDDI